MFTESSSPLTIALVSPYSAPYTDAFFDQNTVDGYAGAVLAVKYTEAVDQGVVGVLLQFAFDDALRPRRQNWIGRSRNDPGSAADRPNPRGQQTFYSSFIS
jgi:uncharacterized protein YidB (DUF937 family)